MRLEPDTACTELRTYRTDVPPGHVARVVAAFSARVAAVRRASVPGVVSLGVGRDEVVLVISTGRIQIRVDAGAPRDSRRHRAEALFVELLRAARACGAAATEAPFD